MDFHFKSNAKLNLGLNVIGKRKDGYHNLDMVMVPIDLYDDISVKMYNEIGDLKITCNNKNIPTNKNNILSKIHNEFFKKIKRKKEKITVYINKSIPSEAGLGGGSSNGAFFLKFLNRYYNTKLSNNEIIEISKNIGADIPFFIINKISRVRGIGEIVDPYDYKFDKKVLLVKPNFGIETKFAFSNYFKTDNMKSADIEKILKGLRANNIKELNNSIFNFLEYSLMSKNINLKEFKKFIDEFKKFNFFMTGSGSCFYSFLTDDIDEEYIKEFSKTLEKIYTKNYFISINRIL